MLTLCPVVSTWSEMLTCAIPPQSWTSGTAVLWRPWGRLMSLTTGAVRSWPGCWRAACRGPRRQYCTAPPCWYQRGWRGAWLGRFCVWRPASPVACVAASSTSTWSWTRAASGWRASLWMLPWCPRSRWPWCWSRTAGRGPACGTSSSWEAALSCRNSGTCSDSARASGSSRRNCTRPRLAPWWRSAERNAPFTSLPPPCTFLDLLMRDTVLIFCRRNYKLAGDGFDCTFVMKPLATLSVCVSGWMGGWMTGFSCEYLRSECVYECCCPVVECGFHRDPTEICACCKVFFFITFLFIPPTDALFQCR